MTQLLDNADLAFLGMLGWPQLMNAAVRLYSKNEPLFNQFLHPHIVCMMDAYMQLLVDSKKTGVKPGRDATAATLAEAVARSAGDNIDKASRERANRILERYTVGDIPEFAESTQLVMKQFKRESTKRLTSNISVNDDIDALASGIKKLTSELDTFTKKEDKRKFIYKPFEDIGTLLKQQPLIPTGIRWLDDASHGGFPRGDCVLVLGGSGGGKSTLAVQLSVAQSILANCTAWVTYEQSLYGDLSERMVANSTGIPLDRIRNKGYEMLDQDIKDKFDTIVEQAKDSLIAIDMAQFNPDTGDSDDVGGMYSVCKRIKEMKDSGSNITYVIVDWIGAMVSRICARTGQNQKNDFSAIAQREILYAHDFAEKEGVIFIFFHQTDTEAQEAKATFMPIMTNARDDHGLCFYFDGVFTIGRRDKHNVCWFNPAKTRKCMSQPITLRLMGNYSRFDEVHDYIPHRDGNFYNPNDMDDVPGADSSYGAPQEKAAAFSREVE